VSARPLRILLTGFGPFPGAPDNPTGPLVKALARKFRKGPFRVSTHVFRTTYAAVDRDLPRLLKKHKPDALLMFGLATKSRGLRIETRARNRIARFPDATFVIPESRVIDTDAPNSLPIRAPKMALLRAAKSGGLPARLSLNAGDYLCNYLYWHALTATGRRGGPTKAAFVHVPALSKRVTPEMLVTTGDAILRKLAASLRRPRPQG
jgi:pyroglutamyl-peptidase